MSKLAENKKIIVVGILFFVALFIFLLSITIKPSARKAAKRDPIKLVMWGVWDDSALINSYVTEYQKLYPHVTVEYKKKTFVDYEKDLVNDLAENRGPDIFAAHNTWLGKHKNKMAAVPSSIMTTDEFKKTFVDAVAADFIDGDKAYAIPLFMDNLSLFYNKDAFNDAGIVEPPKTWEEVQNYVKKLTKIDRNGNIIQAGIALGNADNVNRAPDILAALMIQSGANMGDRQSKKSSFASSVQQEGKNINPGATALEFYTDFANPKKDVYTWNSRQHYSIDAFYERQAVMALGYSYQIENIKAKSPRLNFGVAKLPQISLQENLANFSNYWAYTVSARGDERKIEESYKFLSFLAQKENNQSYFLSTKRITPRRDLIDTQRKDVEYGIFAEQSLQSKTWYQPDNTAVDKIFNDMINNVNKGLYNYAEAVQEAQKQINVLTGT